MTTQNLAQDACESKSRRRPSTPRPDPWYKRYPQDYKRGTRKLSLAARGAYSDILDMIYMDAGPIPDDDFAIACELRVKMRQWLAVRKELFAAGKLISRGGFISNPKAEEVMAEREDAKKATAKRKPRTVLGAASRVAERCVNNVATESLFQGNANEINDGCTTEAEADTEADVGVCGEVEKLTTVEQAAAAPANIGSGELSRLLHEAAGDALASHATAPGLASMMFPQMWLEQGCDLHKDILPTIRAVASRPRQKHAKISTWKYFHRAVGDAKIIRDEGLPTVHRDPRDFSGSRQSPHMRELEECRVALAAG